MSKVIIFGLDHMAELAYFYLTKESDEEVVAFCVYEKDLPKEEEFIDKPIISFEKVEEIFPIKDYKFFAPMSSEKMNTEREGVYNAIKNKGYKMISFISNKSIVYTDDVGDNCFIQAGLAANCTVGENSYLGTNSTIRDGIVLAKGTLVGLATVITKNTEEWSVYMGNPAKRIGKNISKSILKI